MKYYILFALIIIKISFVPMAFANHQAGGVTLALGLGFPVGLIKQRRVPVQTLTPMGVIS